MGLVKTWGFLELFLHWDLTTGCYKPHSDTSLCQHQGRMVLPVPPGQLTDALACTVLLVVLPRASSQGEPELLLAPSSLKATMSCDFFSWKRS